MSGKAKLSTGLEAVADLVQKCAGFSELCDGYRRSAEAAEFRQAEQQHQKPNCDAREDQHAENGSHRLNAGKLPMADRGA